MAWHIYEPRLSLAAIGKLPKPDGLDKTEAKQFTRAKRLAKQIAESGEIGPKTGAFDVSLAGHSKDADGERAPGITVSIAQDHVS